MKKLSALLLACIASLSIANAATPPMVGERPPDFKLSTPEGKVVQLSEVMAKGPVVLVVLRGYHGYQCPYCNRQV
jgi:peroxiredoxin